MNMQPFTTETWPPRETALLIETETGFIIREWDQWAFNVMWFDENGNHDDSIQNAKDREHWLCWTVLEKSA